MTVSILMITLMFLIEITIHPLLAPKQIETCFQGDTSMMFASCFKGSQGICRHRLPEEMPLVQ